MPEIRIEPGQYWEVQVEIVNAAKVGELHESFKGCGPSRFDDALQLARGCLVLARMSSSDEDDAYARMRLAEVFLRRGDIDDALEQAGMALVAYQSHDNFVGAAQCEQLRGEAFLDRGEAAQALESFADARVIFDATGSDLEALRCETRLAITLHYAGDYRAAARANSRLADAYRQLED